MARERTAYETLAESHRKVLAERDTLRALWLEWLEGTYDGRDLLRRVKLAVHGPLRKPGNAGVAPVEAPSSDVPDFAHAIKPSQPWPRASGVRAVRTCPATRPECPHGCTRHDCDSLVAETAAAFGVPGTSSDQGGSHG